MEAFEEQLAIRQSGDLVVERPLSQQLLELLARLTVLDRSDDSGRRPVGRTNGQCSTRDAPVAAVGREDAVVECNSRETAGHRDTQFLTDPIQIVGMHRVEPYRGPITCDLVLVTEQFHAPTRVVNRVRRQIPIPEPIVRGGFPQAVALFARPHCLDQLLLFEGSGQQRSPLVVRLASIDRQRVDFAGDSEQSEVVPACLHGNDDRDLVRFRSR